MSNTFPASSFFDTLLKNNFKPFDRLRMRGAWFIKMEFLMKLLHYSMIASICCSLSAAQRLDDFVITLDPTWQNLECDQDRCKTFGGKWVIIGSITFKKKAKEPVNLTRLYLRWNGEHLDTFVGSLYKKPEDKDFLAIQDNLVCDGTWDTSNQTLLFNFDQKQTLGLTNIFYVVLTIPEHVEPQIKQGSFELMTHYLPEQFQPVTNQQLSLAYHTPKKFFTK
jgi:hypothetical protein